MIHAILPPFLVTATTHAFEVSHFYGKFGPAALQRLVGNIWRIWRHWL